ncbi:hypothetical protein [Aurantimonas sp. 22II-16-19i]|uniref:hypothetical protein n=1 Tax=Aurantimonas sp. 22II-16-19i TaxID=1317114 RepID=UPI0009F7DA7B|nr:hypothetical protein [Aurantimonas sp. 22II-16-19i]ORE98671.1 hypothetical protein ATO4_04125 [Aurantimonas sp. 22II-16-19i]
MMNAEAAAAFAAKELATHMLIRQLYVLMSEQLGTGTDGLRAWRDELERQLDDRKATTAEAAAAMDMITPTAKILIRGVFAPIIGESAA